MTKIKIFHKPPHFFNRLVRSDFLGDAFDVAKKTLLGAYLCSHIDGQLTVGKITEIEVYTGGEDKASHTYQNKRTTRTEPIFKIGGHAYVFLVYGMHHQFCVVVCEENNPCCILIRAVKPIFGLETMKFRRKINNMKQLTNGPAKVCQAFGITRNLSGIDLLTGPVWICPKSEQTTINNIIATTRIGIDYAGEYALKKWRFILKDNPFISKK
jgi:DNA-3-methyladenine glycosylase